MTKDYFENVASAFVVTHYNKNKEETDQPISVENVALMASERIDDDWIGYFMLDNSVDITYCVLYYSSLDEAKIFEYKIQENNGFVKEFSKIVYEKE